MKLDSLKSEARIDWGATFIVSIGVAFLAFDGYIFLSIVAILGHALIVLARGIKYAYQWIRGRQDITVPDHLA